MTDMPSGVQYRESCVVEPLYSAKKMGWRNPGSIISPVGTGLPKKMSYPDRTYPILFILGASMPSHAALFYFLKIT